MRARLASVGIWLLLALLAVFAASRARYTADLSAFLPTAPSAAQRLLVEQLRDGPAARLVLIDIEGGEPAERARRSQALARRLRETGEFRSVANGEGGDLERDRAFVINRRYALSEQVTPERFTVAGLRAAIAETLDLLASPIGLLARDLLVRDPTGETLQVLEQLQHAANPPRSADGVWSSRDGRRVLLLAETRAAGSDTDGQQRALESVRTAFDTALQPGAAARPGPVLRLTGAGVFAVQARATIQRAAIRLSIVSALLIATLLLLVYRSISLLLLGLLPVASGALAGVAAVALGYGVVHGVTLGFGVTLIGEAVDYSVYLFMQAEYDASNSIGAAGWTATLWPTIRLGMLTSICGFASLLPSAFPGLAQLGVYSIAGLTAAGLTTRYLLPQLMTRGLAAATGVALGMASARVLARLRPFSTLLWLLPALAGLALYQHRDGLWNRELAALSPIPAAEQQLDGELRAELGAADVRTLIVLSAAECDRVLAAGEAVGRQLERLVDAGVIAGYQSASRYLPSRATQARRRASLPPRAELAARLRAALTGLPLRPERLQPFLEDVEAARTAPLLSRADLASTPFAAAVDALLLPQQSGCAALMPLAAPATGAHALQIDFERVRAAVAGAPTPGVVATVLDLKREADSLYSGYLAEALKLSAAGFAAIVVLLVVALRSARRIARVMAPLALAVLVVPAAFAIAGKQLTILHLIGLLLVVAIGSNYALFFDRDRPTDAAGARMLASLMVANLSTVIAFGSLSLSGVPVLAALGATVAPGALLALVFAAVLARPESRS